MDVALRPASPRRVSTGGAGDSNSLSVKCGGVTTPTASGHADMRSSSPVSRTNRKSHYIIDEKEIKLGERVGMGATADVFRGVWKGTEVAVKRFHNGFKTSWMNSEAMIMLQIRHPNLVLVMGIVDGVQTKALVSEFCGGGTLFSLLHNPIKSPPGVLQPNQITWRQRLKIALDIAKGSAYLHSWNPPILHRDLKTLNILLTAPLKLPSDIPYVKISDFGLSTTQTGNERGHLAGTLHWMAPEVLRDQEYSKASDVYSFGIVLFELITNEIPYRDLGAGADHNAFVHQVVVKKRLPDMTALPVDCPSHLKYVSHNKAPGHFWLQESNLGMPPAGKASTPFVRNDYQTFERFLMNIYYDMRPKELGR